MLSRLAARTGRIASRSLAQPRALAAPAFTRTFKSTPASLNVATPAAPATPAPAATADSFSDIVEKYGGATTFWGCIAAIMLNKEIFILDAEFLLGIEIVAFATTAYVLTGNALEKYCEEEDASAKKQFDGANDFALAMFNQYKMAKSVDMNKPVVLKEYAAEYKAAIEAYAKTQTVAPQHQARASVMAALQGIKAKEDAAASEEWHEFVDDAVANVTAAFEANDPALNDAMINLAISKLGFETPTTTEAEDPVKRLFLAELEDAQEA